MNIQLSEVIPFLLESVIEFILLYSLVFILENMLTVLIQDLFGKSDGLLITIALQVGITTLLIMKVIN